MGTSRLNNALYRWSFIALVTALAACGSLAPIIPDDAIDDGVPVPEGSIPVEAFYVAPWGSDNAAGSFSEPWSSLRPLARAASPGTTVYLRGGVYNKTGAAGNTYYSMRVSGTAAAPITIRAFPGEHPVIDGSGHQYFPRSPNDGHSVCCPPLLAFYGEHVVWEGITFRHSVGRSFYIISNHSVFRNLESHSNHSDGFYLQGSWNLFDNIRSFDNNSIANGGNSADGLRFVDGTHVRTVFGSTGETRGNVIRNAVFFDNSDDGLDIWDAWDTTVEYSLAYNNGRGSTGNGIGFKLGGDRRLNTGTIARYNTAYGNINNFDTNSSTGATLYNNTSFDARSIGFVLRDRSERGANTAFNNISYRDPHPASTNTLTIQSHNSWNLGLSEPQFESLDRESSRFLALSATSPAIDRGKANGHPFAGLAPDLGALERGHEHLGWATLR